MRSGLVGGAAAMALLIAACGGASEPSTEPQAGVPAPVLVEPGPIAYTPTAAGLAYALPSAVSGVALLDPPPEAISADELQLAQDPLIRRELVERGLGPDIIRVAQRSQSYAQVPTISVTAVQFKDIDAQAFAEFVPSVYLLATSVSSDQFRLTGAKPPRHEAVIEGRAVQTSDWGTFDVVWYPHGDVVFIVVAENPQLLAAALRALPPYGGAG